MPTIELLVQWIKAYVAKAGKDGVVIGLSGGIDSTVVCALACKALGKENVAGVIMPCFSNPEDEKAARAVVEWLQLEDVTRFDLGSIQEEFQGQLVEAIKPDTLTPKFFTKVLIGNIRARLRMTTLYAIAEARNYLVAGTGNLSELMIGYLTKYGDGGVDFEPLGNLYKTEVYEIARELGVPELILNRKPTAGLWEGQTDEDELGMTYEQLDKTLKKFAGDLKAETGNEDKVAHMVAASRHKREVPPAPER